MNFNHVSNSYLEDITHAEAHHDYVHIIHSLPFIKDYDDDKNVQENAQSNPYNKQHFETHHTVIHRKDQDAPIAVVSCMI